MMTQFGTCAFHVKGLIVVRGGPAGRLLNGTGCASHSTPVTIFNKIALPEFFPKVDATELASHSTPGRVFNKVALPAVFPSGIVNKAVTACTFDST